MESLKVTQTIYSYTKSLYHQMVKIKLGGHVSIDMPQK